ncbi:ABC transporter permease [Allorhizocola rhizosphaerae]|uniref:ABC transporter permease n=1 Tax=Allorhizocola rhizosphaerae TaxID=1872709 RepID=UPI000E3C37FE|nr:ABC transporter permease subunit [Allorhizocola rhizosphaerae]
MPAESVIHDIGYQRYTGPRLGRAYATRSLFVHGLRAAFGLGRSAKAKIFPWTVAGLIGVIALIFAVAAAQGEEVSYQDLPQVASVLILVFLAVVAPELVSRDLRNKTLPLYFSRPIHRRDYALAKLASLTCAVWLILAGPLTLIFAAGAFGGGDVWTDVRGLLSGYAVAAFYAVIFSALALLIASIASRRAIAAGAIAAVFLVTLPVVGVLMEVGEGTVEQLAPLGSPVMLPEGIRTWVFHTGELEIGGFGPLYGAVGVLLPLACALLLLLRYRKVSL